MPRLTTDQRAQLHAGIADGTRYTDLAARFGININTVTHHARSLGYGPKNRRRNDAPAILPETLTALLVGEPVPLRGTPPWMEDGSCRRIDDPDVFYPKSERFTGEAKAICSRCPVRTICLEWAIAHREPHGVWGGLSELERRRLTDQGTTGQEATAC